MSTSTIHMRTRSKDLRVRLKVLGNASTYELFIMENDSTIKNSEAKNVNVSVTIAKLGFKYFETQQFISYLLKVDDIRLGKVKDEVTALMSSVTGIVSYTSIDALGKLFTRKRSGGTKINLEVTNDVNFYIVTPYMTLSSPLINIKGSHVSMCKDGGLSEIALSLILNIKCSASSVFEPLIEKISLKTSLTKHEGTSNIKCKISTLLANVKPDMLEALLEIGNILKNKQNYRNKVTSLVINNRLGINIKATFDLYTYVIEDEIKSIDVSSGIRKNDYNMDFKELIGNEALATAQDMIQKFQAAIDRIELAEELKVLSISSENFGALRKPATTTMQITISPEATIDINLAVEGKFLTPLYNKEYKVLVSTSFLNGAHHIEVKPCLEIINKTSQKFYVVLFKKSLDKGITRSSSLNQIVSESPIEKPQMLAIGSKKLKQDDSYVLPFMNNVDNYFMKICEHFENKPNNVYNIRGLLKNKSASVSTNEDVS